MTAMVDRPITVYYSSCLQDAVLCTMCASLWLAGFVFSCKTSRIFRKGILQAFHRYVDVAARDKENLKKVKVVFI